ncbi:glutathione peroxidase [Marinilactibacillus sp. Marseille-P9653]|uniref:glutathione peroxidase n=1 Tax=Marinilactibacillus sp. Marseille-P9653 TaxID=2866583 RepID=UPI001CE3D7D9|nr:glutathione peroxidase [Marinilactibacillus sp. Marseille-P9653]
MTIADFTVKNLEGKDVDLSNYTGKPILIVNTASKCGLASQLKDLEELYQSYKDRGFIVLGFPCNQFMNQEPLESGEIAEFCNTNYDVTFPMFDKVNVNGADAHPLFKHLKEKTGNKMIKWNYTKFLIDSNGEVINRYAPTTKPVKIVEDLVSIL